MNVVPIKSQKTILMEFRKIILLDLVFLINLPSSLSLCSELCVLLSLSYYFQNEFNFRGKCKLQREILLLCLEYPAVSM